MPLEPRDKAGELSVDEVCFKQTGQLEAAKCGEPCRLGQDDICRTGNLSLLGASQAALAQTAHGDSSRKRPCLPNHLGHGAACISTVFELWPQR